MSINHAKALQGVVMQVDREERSKYHTSSYGERGNNAADEQHLHGLEADTARHCTCADMMLSGMLRYKLVHTAFISTDSETFVQAWWSEE
jgi:hypothetical protein